MQVTTKKLPKSQIELTIEVTPQEIEPYLDRAASDLSKKMNVPGFRPGKIPRSIVEEHLGKQEVLEEAANSSVTKFYVKAILTKKIEAIGKPKITVVQIAPENPLIFKAVTAVMPEIKLAPYTEISRKIKREAVAVKDKEIKDTLGWLQNSRAKLITVKRPAQLKDRVEIDFESRLGGVKIDEGDSKNHPLIIGKNQFVPGFEEKLIGMKEGDTRQFALTFPKNHSKKDLADKLVDFKVEMKLVQKRELPKLDDQFAESLGNFKDLKALKASVKVGLKKELERRASEQWRIKVIEDIAEESQMEIPDVLIETELEKMLQEFKESIKQMGLKLEEYLKKIHLTEEKLKEKWLGQALKRVKIGLVLREIAKKENIKPSDEEVKEKANGILKSYSDDDDKDAKEKLDPDQLKEYANGLLRNEKVFEFLEKLR